MKQYLTRFGLYLAFVAFCAYKFVTSAQHAQATSSKNKSDFSNAAFEATRHAGDVMLFWMGAMFGTIFFAGLLLIFFAPRVQTDDHEDEPDPKAPMEAPPGDQEARAA